MHSVALFTLVKIETCVVVEDVKTSVALTGRNITGPPSRDAPG